MLDTLEDVVDLIPDAHLGHVDPRDHVSHGPAQGLEVNQGVEVLQLDGAEQPKQVARIVKPEIQWRQRRRFR